MSCRVSRVPSPHLAILFCTVLVLGWGLVAAQTEQKEPEPEASPPRADLSAANELVKQRKYDEAETTLAALQEEFPEDPDLLFMRGELLLALQRPVDAMPLLREVAELEPDRPRVHFQLATALSATGDADAALEEFAVEIAHNGDPEVRTLALLNRSMLFQQQRDWPGAASELEQFLELDKSRSEAYGDLASLYIQAGDLAAAADALERGVAAGFESAQHFYSLGARWYKAERYENSVAALSRALEIDPQLARAERSVAAALERLDRNEEAVQHLQRYLELAPDAPDADKVADRIKAARAD